MNLLLIPGVAAACLIGGCSQAGAQSPEQRYQQDVTCAANTAAMTALGERDPAATVKTRADGQTVLARATKAAQKSGAAVGKSGDQVSGEIAAARGGLLASVPSDPAAAKQRTGEIGRAAMSCTFAKLEEMMGKNK